MLYTMVATNIPTGLVYEIMQDFYHQRYVPDHSRLTRCDHGLESDLESQLPIILGYSLLILATLGYGRLLFLL